MKIEDFLEQEFGFDKSIKSGWNSYVNLWKSWYQGNVQSFHDYYIFNGKRKVKKQKLSLQMAKKVCEDWADILFNERVKFEVASSDATTKLFNTLEGLDFWEFMNASIEKSGATGTGAIVMSISNVAIDMNYGTADFSNQSINLDYVDVLDIYPLSWNNGRVTECAFTTTKMIKGDKYIFLAVHTKQSDGTYLISNKIFLANKNIDEITLLDDNIGDEFGIVESFETNSKTPFFAILKPSGANNLKFGSPYGLPYFAQSLDILKRIDNTFDALQTEIDLGRRRLFVRQEMTSVDIDTGENFASFDPNDISIYMLPKGFESQDLLQSEASALRVNDLTVDLENSLALFGDNVGFGVQYYQLDPTGQVREIGILTQNSKLIRRKRKHERYLESCIFDLLTSIMLVANINSDGLKITFDNDIIDDENQRKTIALTEVSSGVMSKAEYRMEFYGETEEIANKKIEDIKSESSVNFGITENIVTTD